MNTYTKVQHSRSYFDMDVDFTPVINWNNNITFIWITAEYTTGKQGNEKTSSVTIYDKIIPRADKHLYHLILKDQIFEYPIVDYYSTLSGKEVKLTLNWEHMPVIGPILKHSLDLGKVTLPTANNKPHNLMIESEYHYEDLDQIDRSR